jgi:pyrroline-5-carboxylate reductase
MSNITIIGAGNMGSAIAAGLITTGSDPSTLCLIDHDTRKLHALQQRYGVHVDQDLPIAVSRANIIILAVKPQMMVGLLKTLRSLQHHHLLVISIAAGVRVKTFEDYLGENTAIIRCMPNTPVLVQQGMSILYANRSVTQQQHDVANAIFSTVGQSLWVEKEDQLDSVTALSGSGPAYFFLLFAILQRNLVALDREKILELALQVMTNKEITEQYDDPLALVFSMILQSMLIASEGLSLPVEIAHQCVLQTAKGAIVLAQQSDKNFEELQQEVTSKGGTTAAAIEVLETQQFASAIQQIILRDSEALDEPSIQMTNIFQQAFRAACKRAQELSEEAFLKNR